jgi:hypothetical protein
MGWMAPLRHRRATLVFYLITRNREPSMSEITTIGLDLAKHVFQVHLQPLRPHNARTRARAEHIQP